MLSNRARAFAEEHSIPDNRRKGVTGGTFGSPCSFTGG
jgi:hypothetical protein